MKRIYLDPTAHLGRAARGDYAGPAWYDLALAALQLRREGPRGELLALAALPPPRPPRPHQVSGAVGIVERLGSRALLADDEALDPVGTAALVAREWAVRSESPTLVLAPAARMAPWLEAFTGWQGLTAPCVIPHDQAARVLTQRWDNVILDGAHAALSDEALRVCAKRILLVTSTPIRTGAQDLIVLLAMLGGTPDPSGLRRHAIRRRASGLSQSRLADVVRLDGLPAERHLMTEARELASAAILAGGEGARSWRQLLQAAEALPASLGEIVARALERDPEALGRARVLALLESTQLAASRSPSKFEALIPLVAGAAGRTLVCVASAQAASWVQLALAARGLPLGEVWVAADGDPEIPDARGFANLVHLDAPWDPRRLASRLARLEGQSEFRSFHLTLAGSVEEQVLWAYQDSLALAAPAGEVAAAIAEAPGDPETAIGAAVVAGGDAFGGWAATLSRCRAAARQARLATAQVFDDLDLDA